MFSSKAYSLALLALPLVNAQIEQNDGDRLLLAIQKPKVTDVADGTVTVEFNTGPNVVLYTYAVSCYEKDDTVPTTSCGAVIDQGLSPLGSATDTLPNAYSQVVVEIDGLPSSTEVDCFVSVGGGIGDIVTKCQYAGTVSMPVFIRASVTAESTGSPDELLIRATNASRAMMLDELLGQVSDRSATVPTLAVQCLPEGATECDGSDETLWTPTTEGILFPPGSGQVVSSLVPNTEHVCFAALSYEEDGSTKYSCTPYETAAVADTTVAPPTSTSATTTGTNDPTTELVVSTTVTAQGDAEILTYKVQCLDATLTTPSACDEGGNWVDAADPGTGQLVGSLMPNTPYTCFAAATYDDSVTTNYACSRASPLIATDVAAPSSIGTAAGSTPSTEIVVTATAAVDGGALALGYAVQCIKTADVPVGGGCDSTATWVTATSSELSSGVTVGSTTPLEPSTAYTCFAAATYDDGVATQYVCSAGSQITTGAPPSNFQLASNGVTVVCPNANIGDSGVVTIGGSDVTFTKRDQTGLLALRNADNFSAMATTCTTGVTSFMEMFFNKATFNEDISHWDTSSATSMRNMFYGASVFDGDIGDWDVSLVETMRYMFGDAQQFNKPLNNWVPSSVINMELMFNGASSFNQNLTSWNLPNGGSSTSCTDSFATGANTWLTTYAGTIKSNPPLSQSMIDAGCGP